MTNMLTPERIELLALRSRCKDLEAAASALRAESRGLRSVLEKTRNLLEWERRDRRKEIATVERGVGVICLGICFAAAAMACHAQAGVSFWLANLYMAGAFAFIFAAWTACANWRLIRRWLRRRRYLKKGIR